MASGFRLARPDRPSPPTLAELEAPRSSGRPSALAFWGCLRLAENPDWPDDLRQQARRRMRQLAPELHTLFMRHGTHG